MAEHADSFQLVGSNISDGRMYFYGWTYLILSVGRVSSFNQSQLLLQVDGA